MSTSAMQGGHNNRLTESLQSLITPLKLIKATSYSKTGSTLSGKDDVSHAEELRYQFCNLHSIITKIFN